MARAVRRTWSILTPEYPPDSGGIGDYIELVARRLAELGDDVRVFTRSPPFRTPTPHVALELLPDDFGAATRRRLDAAWRELPEHAVVLVQYVPQGFGRRGMNVPFLRWLGARRERRWLMIHEAAFPFDRHQPPRRWVFAAVTRLMLLAATRNAEHVFTSIPAWEQFIEPWSRSGSRPEWLPIPATLGPDPAGLVSKELLPSASESSATVPATVAHFGTYGEFLAGPLKQVLPSLLARRGDLELVLLGAGSERFRADLLALVPGAASRVRATGRVGPEVVASELARAGAVIFPFTEGASTRRTSLMAALAVGAAIVTMDGEFSESFWRTSGAVSVYPSQRPELGVEAVLALLADPARRAEQRRRALELYHERFRLDLVVERLQHAYDASLAQAHAPRRRASTSS
jgi:glycosyltransferase involved in cell wall biosynthesis